MSVFSNSKTLYLNFIIIFLIFILDRLTKLYVIYLDKINSRSSHQSLATRSGGSSLFSSLLLISIFFYLNNLSLKLFAQPNHFY